MSSEIVIGILGCAHIHIKDHVTFILHKKNIRVDSIWDESEERAKQYCQQLRCVFAKDPDEILSNKEISAVLICSETDQHDDLVIAAFQAQKSIFVEKPLAVDASRTKKILAHVDMSRSILHVGFFLRANSGLKRLRELIQEGALGEITLAHMEFCHSGLLDQWFTGHEWMMTSKHAGFGDLAIHLVDLLVWMFGDVDEVKAIASHNTDRDHAYVSRKAILKFKTGSLASIATGWRQRGEMFYMIVRGTAGSAIVSNQELKISYTQKNKACEETFSFHPKAEESLAVFCRAIEAKHSHELLAKDEILTSSSILDYIYASTASPQ